MVTKVLSVGGSIVVPEKPDTDFLCKFIAMIRNWLNEDSQRRLILVVGGGMLAERIWEKKNWEDDDPNIIDAL